MCAPQVVRRQLYYACFLPLPGNARGLDDCAASAALPLGARLVVDALPPPPVCDEEIALPIRVSASQTL